MDLRKNTTLIADDFTNSIHRNSTLSDAAQHLTGKPLFCKFDCSQACHCLHTADQRSVEMLAFNFASRTFAYKKLAQVLSRSVSASASLMREYLDPVVKTGQRANYVDYIGIAANNSRDLTWTIGVVFKRVRQAWLKLIIEKYQFGFKQAVFLGRTISPEGISPKARKLRNYRQIQIPQIKKCITTLCRTRELIHKLCLQNGWNVEPILQIAQIRSTNQHYLRAERHIWFCQ